VDKPGVVETLLGARLSARRRHFAIAVVVVIVALWAARGTGFDPVKLAVGLPQFFELLGRMLPPDLDMLTRIGGPLLQTLEMALIGTTAGMVIALPLAFLAAGNTTPNAAFGTVLRMLIAALRTVPELIWAMVLVTAVGLGPFPGIIALTLHTIGGLGKLYYEAIESVPAGAQEAMTAVGAGRLRTILFGVMPNALPLLISNTLFYWEYNNRASTILGLVGAGGIGFALTNSIAGFNYREATTCLIAIVLILTVIDRLSASLRRRVI
jgi:phosphonate transport system permease protein